MKRLRLGIIGLLILYSCDTAPIKTTQTDNKDIVVELLFTHDGCRVYRFHDEGSAKYFVNCGQSQAAEWEQSCGKNCTEMVQIQTEIKK